MNAIEKLVSLGSAEFAEPPKHLGGALDELIGKKNGFYLFEGAMRIYASVTTKECLGHDDWRRQSFYADVYRTDLLLFADDVFCHQFGIDDSGVVYSLNPESGAISEISSTLEGWSAKVLKRFDYFSGHSVARKWQESHGVLKDRERLFPKVPFLLGGRYAVENLFACEDVVGLRYLSDVCEQTKSMPNGTKVILRVPQAE